MSPPLRASNEGRLRPRVARAQGTHRAIPLLLAGFFSILLAVFGEADQIQMVVVVGENRFRLVAETHEQMNIPASTQHRAGKELMGIGRNQFDFAYQRFSHTPALVGGIDG